MNRMTSIVCMAAIATVLSSAAPALAQDPTPRSMKPAMAGRTATLNTADGYLKLRLRDDALFDVEVKMKERELVGRGMLLTLEEAQGDRTLYAVVYDKGDLAPNERPTEQAHADSTGLVDALNAPPAAPQGSAQQQTPAAEESATDKMFREAMEEHGGLPPIELRIRVLSDSEIEAQMCETRLGRAVREAREAARAAGRAIVNAAQFIAQVIKDTPEALAFAVLVTYYLAAEGVRELIEFMGDAARFLRHILVDVVYKQFLVETLAKQVIRDFLLKRVLRDIVIRKVFGEILIKKVFVEILGKKVLRDAIGKKFFRDWIWRGGIKRFGKFVADAFRLKKPCSGRLIQAEVEIMGPEERAFLREQDQQDELIHIEAVVEQVSQSSANTSEGLPLPVGGRTR